MTHLAAHRVSDGDTLESIVTGYGLSSSAALTEIPANAPLRPVLASEQGLPEGLLIYIPPPALRLARDRLYLVHAIRPVLQSHFDVLRALAESDLAPGIRAWCETGNDEPLLSALAAMKQRVLDTIESAASQARPIIANCRGMLLTHVSTPTDHAVVGASEDPLCGLYWAVTPPILEQWQILWDADSCLPRWAGRQSGDVVDLARRNLNTLSSLVMQQVDKRIRESQALESSLRAEQSVNRGVR